MRSTTVANHVHIIGGKKNALQDSADGTGRDDPAVLQVVAPRNGCVLPRFNTAIRDRLRSAALCGHGATAADLKASGTRLVRT